MTNLLETGKRTVNTVVRREKLAAERLGSARRFLILPSIALLSGFLSFLAFPWGGDTDAYGLGMGGASLIYFSWSLILASRLKFVERAFGGFDRLHLWHRLFSMLAILTMWLHGMAENTVAQAVTTFGVELSELGYNMAELSQNLFVALTVISIFRILPYQIWKLSHKLFIIPFALGAFHFFTSENTFSIFSAWGFYFAGFVALGLVAFGYRLLIVDTGWTFRKFEVTDVDNRVPGSKVLTLSPKRLAFRKIRPGSFVFISFPALSREVHPFSVSGQFPDGTFKLSISMVGDWTEALDAVSVGDQARVSPPMGSLELDDPNYSSRLWFAAGSGIAPFLSGAELLDDGKPTKLIYSYRGDAAISLDQVREWQRNHPNFELVEIDTTARPRLTDQEMTQLFNDRDQWTVACGPEQMIDGLRRASRKSHVPLEFELFDYRLAYDLRNPIEKIFDFIEGKTQLRLNAVREVIRRA